MQTQDTYSRRQRELVNVVAQAARDGRFCYHSGSTWVIVKKGSRDLVLQIDFARATAVHLNAREAAAVIRANPPHKAPALVQELETGLGEGRENVRFRTLL